MAAAAGSRQYTLRDENFSDCQEERVDTTHFEILKMLGTGAFGKVFLVRKVRGHNAGKLYAMKTLKKASIIHVPKTTEHTKNERSILEAVQKAPFVVHLHYAFQTHDNLALILDFVNGGELFQRMKMAGSLSECDARFYIAEIILAVEFLHSIGVIYRDLKQENILLDREGHIVLTDFGLSKEKVGGDGRTFSFAGTVDYMAPELFGGGHSFAVDWWSVGVLLWELVAGVVPFHDADRDHAVLETKIKTAPLSFPPHFSAPLRSLLAKLLDRNPDTRLGSGPAGAAAIRADPFFESLDWSAVRDRSIAPPYVPVIEDETDVGNFDEEFTLQAPVLSPSTESVPAAAQMLFRGFSYVAPDVLHTPTPFDFDVMPPSAFLASYSLTSFTLGAGSFSVCRKCVHLETKKEYACKIVCNAKGDPAREAAILTKIKGVPGLVSMHEVFSSPSHHYIVLEWMRGGPLLDRIKDKESFDEMEARDLFQQILSAVSYLHAHGIVHRDLKPDNLLFVTPAEDSRIVIADFGFAREYSSAPLKTPCYTVPYGAPEVIDSTAVLGYGPSADMWSLGVVLYTMLCGYTPFNLTKSKHCFHNELVKKVCETPVAFPATHWRHVSRNALDLVRQLLNKDPLERIAAPDAMTHAWLGEGGPSRSGYSLATPAILRSDGLDDSLSASSALNVFLHPLRPLSLDIGLSTLAQRRKRARAEGEEE